MSENTRAAGPNWLHRAATAILQAARDIGACGEAAAQGDYAEAKRQLLSAREMVGGARQAALHLDDAGEIIGACDRLTIVADHAQRGLDELIARRARAN